MAPAPLLLSAVRLLMCAVLTAPVAVRALLLLVAAAATWVLLSVFLAARAARLSGFQRLDICALQWWVGFEPGEQGGTMGEAQLSQLRGRVAVSTGLRQASAVRYMWCRHRSNAC